MLYPAEKLFFLSSRHFTLVHLPRNVQTNAFFSLDDASSSVGYVGAGGGDLGVGGGGLSGLNGLNSGSVAVPPSATARANSSRGSFNKNEQPAGHLTPSHFARSSSLGGIKCTCARIVKLFTMS